MATKTLKLTLVKSLIGRKPNHIKSARGLGLTKTNSTSEVVDTPSNRGMIEQISYLLQVEEQAMYLNTLKPSEGSKKPAKDKKVGEYFVRRYEYNP